MASRRKTTTIDYVIKGFDGHTDYSYTRPTKNFTDAEDELRELRAVYPEIQFWIEDSAGKRYHDEHRRND